MNFLSTCQLNPVLTEFCDVTLLTFVHAFIWHLLICIACAFDSLFPVENHHKGFFFAELTATTPTWITKLYGLTTVTVTHVWIDDFLQQLGYDKA